MMTWAVGPVWGGSPESISYVTAARAYWSDLASRSRVAGGLLGTHVVRGAEGEAGLGDPGAAGLGHGQRDAEVGDHRLARLEQDVLRLEVPVDHALGVGVGQGIGEQGDETHRLVHRQLALALQPRAQGLALT